MKELLIAFVLAQSADMATTHIGISRGCVEVNPLYAGASIPVIYALKGTSMAIIGSVAWGGRKRKPGLARVVLWTGIVAGVGAAVWNTTQFPLC